MLLQAMLSLGAPLKGAEPLLAPEVVFRGEARSEPGQDNAVGNEENDFETDRDSFTPATSTVRPGRVMVESAWSFVDNRRVPETHSLPELVLRYGATDWLELRFGTNYEVGGESAAVTGSDFGDEPDDPTGKIVRATTVSYGCKLFLTEQQGWLPQSSLILMGNTPASGPETASDVVCTYAWGWTFDNGWKWDSAIRYGTGSAESDQFNRWAPSTVLKVPVGERWDLHAEYFGLFTQGRAVDTQVQYFSPGAAYMLTENLEVGVRLGWGLTDESSRFFTNVGLGWQF